MTNPDAAYIQYREVQSALDAAALTAPRWEVRFCLPGQDDVTTTYYANEAAFMCEALIAQTQLGHDTYVRWLEP